MNTNLTTNILILIIITLFTACTSNKNNTMQKEQYLPDIIKNVELGMPQSAVLRLRKKAYIVNSVQETPREIYTEDLETSSYTSVYYLFEKTGNKALVEINILHQDKAAAEQTINNYFGVSKNKKQNQWHKTLKNGRIVHATWRKKKVFIYLDEKEIKVENIREQ